MTEGERENWIMTPPPPVLACVRECIFLDVGYCGVRMASSLAVPRRSASAGTELSRVTPAKAFTTAPGSDTDSCKYGLPPCSRDCLICLVERVTRAKRDGIYTLESKIFT